MNKIYTEKDLILPALKFIAENKMGTTTSELIIKLREELKPEGRDLDKLSGRNDDVFSQKVRNLVSHKTLTKYIYTDNSKMFINDDGKDYVLNYYEDLDIEDLYSSDIENTDDFRDENTGFVAKEPIEIDNIYMSVADLKRKYDRNEKKIKNNSLILDEQFQRNDNIWSPKNKSLFIESIILNIPIPSIYISEDKNGNYIVIDGRQRLSTLFNFINGNFKLKGLSILSDLNGKKYIDLIEEYEKFKLRIEDRSLHIAKIRYGTEPTWIIETFERVNTKGARLNAQEIRNALYQGKSTELLNKISKKYDEHNAIIDKSRMKDKYLILRYFAFKMFYMDFVYADKMFVSITDFLAKIMLKINNSSDEFVNNLEKDFCESYDLAIKIFGKENAFRFKQTLPINMILFEMTLLLTSLLKDKDDNTIKLSLQNLIKHNIDEQNLVEETPFEKNIKYHRDGKENIKERLTWVRDIVEKTNDKENRNK